VASERIHLIAPAGSCRPFLDQAGFDSAPDFIDHVGRVVGGDYEVTGDAEIIAAAEDENRGGRTDDRRRAGDIEAALGDDRVVGILGIRGGAWLTRVLPLIDFSVLDRRTREVTIFGFSELTTLVNIVAAHPMGAGVYDMCPAFLTYGLERYARLHGDVAPDQSAGAWMSDRLMAEFDEHLRDVAAMIEGRGSRRRLSAERVRGPLPDRGEATFCGGNLVVFSTLLGSRHERDVCPAGRWIVLEEINEKVERIDRFLAHLGLCGLWDRCAGVLLGDFHLRDADLTGAVLELLAHHLPPDRDLPVLRTALVGHAWPTAPLPLQVPLVIERIEGERMEIHR
jgi:muramoyltetrapeptide carboxypeptidase